MPRQKTRLELVTSLAAWMSVVAALAFLLLVMLLERVKGDVCMKEPDNSAVERKGGHRWQWRLVDGRKCWYYSNLVLPREELVWSYTDKEFNSDIDRVIERKFYTKEELEALDMIQRFGIKP